MHKNSARERSRVFSFVPQVFFIFENMETYIFQHVEFEGPGILLKLLKDRGHNVHIVKLFAGDPIPHEDDVDFAIIMGGPMSVLDEADHPYFVREKELCRDMVQLSKPLLGICLGAQMIASAFRAAILKAPEKEIGWHPVKWGEKSKAFAKGFGTVNAFHWHGQMFKVPKEATWLAGSEGCENQAFRLGSAIALQFHLEATPDSIASILKNCAEEHAEALDAKCKFVQDEKEIKELTAKYVEDANKFMNTILDEMLRKR